MPALRDAQVRFIAAVLRRPAGATSEPGLRPEGAAQSRRLAIYRVNARENFAAALESAFPVLCAEMGRNEFRSLAWSYQLRQPSTSGNLFETGRRLPAFLAERLAGTADERLADLARLEWAVQEALVAPDGDGRTDLSVLAEISGDAHPGVRLRVHPSVRLLNCRYPVFERWQAHQSGQSAVLPSAAAPELLLVRRAGEGVEVHRLGLLDYRCLEAIAAGKSLDHIAELAMAVVDEPQLGAVLMRWAAAGVITGLATS
jgi:hypothetical protein